MLTNSPFNPVNASRIRVSMKNSSSSTGIIEFKVIGKLSSSLSVSEKTIKSISVFPNPASDKVTLNLGDLATSKNLNISVLDMSGKLIWSKKTIGKNQITLYTQDMNLKNGIYLIKISNSEKVETAKIVVSR